MSLKGRMIKRGKKKQLLVYEIYYILAISYDGFRQLCE